MYDAIESLPRRLSILACATVMAHAAATTAAAATTSDTCDWGTQVLFEWPGCDLTLHRPFMRGVNSNGMLVGTALGCPDGKHYVAWTWSPTRGLTVIEPPEGASSTSFGGVNEHGVAVGAMTVTQPSFPNVQRVFTWTDAGGLETYEDVFPGHHLRLGDIDDDGRIFARMIIEPGAVTGPAQIVSWSTVGPRDVRLHGGPLTGTVSIDEVRRRDGHVIGHANVEVDGTTQHVPILIDPDGGLTPVPFPADMYAKANGARSTASGAWISSAIPHGTVEPESLVVVGDGAPVLLPADPAGSRARGVAINDLGEISWQRIGSDGLFDAAFYRRRYHAGTPSLALDDLVGSELAPDGIEWAPIIMDDGTMFAWGADASAGVERLLAIAPVDRPDTDLTGDCRVDLTDLLLLLARWGDAAPVAGDFDASGTIGFGDLTLMLSDWTTNG